MAADRGKFAEGAFRKALENLDRGIDFAFHRFPDAHAGSFTPAPADFMFLDKGKFFVLEVKEVAHDSRLPYNNFKLINYNRMRKWVMAGAEGWIIVYHAKSKLYRVLPLQAFHVRNESAASWFFGPENGNVGFVTPDVNKAAAYIKVASTL